MGDRIVVGRLKLETVKDRVEVSMEREEVVARDEAI